jgi:transposase-like protein
MKYAASEKLEIIRLVKGSHLPVKRKSEKLGVSRPTFYWWYDQYLQCGEAGLEDRKSHTGRVWNHIPDTVRKTMLEMALEHFVSEACIYRLMRSHDLITSPAIMERLINAFGFAAVPA